MAQVTPLNKQKRLAQVAGCPKAWPHPCRIATGRSGPLAVAAPDSEPLVWAAADTFDLVPGAALPLVLYRERSVSREAALAALNDSELTWGHCHINRFY